MPDPTIPEAPAPAPAPAPASEQNPADAAKAGGEGSPDTSVTGGIVPDAPAASGDDKGAGDADVVPDAYGEFTLPEGVEINPEYLAAMDPVFKELGLSQEKAQKLLSAHAENVLTGETARADAFKQLTTDWLESAKADKEIGGDAFDPNVQAARAAVTQFGTPELHTLLQTYGLGNHPEVIRVFARIGSLLKEDQPGSLTAPTQGKKDRAETLYPDAKS